MLRLLDLWYIMHIRMTFIWLFSFRMLIALVIYICSLSFLSSAAFLFPAAGTQDSFGILGLSVESRSIVDLPFSFLLIWAYFGMLDISYWAMYFISFLWAYVGFCNVLSRDVHDLYYYKVFRLRIILVCMFWYDTVMWYFSPSRVGVLQLWYQSLGFDL